MHIYMCCVYIYNMYTYVLYITFKYTHIYMCVGMKGYYIALRR